jgi:hypothetical protein
MAWEYLPGSVRDLFVKMTPPPRLFKEKFFIDLNRSKNLDQNSCGR